MKNIASIQRTFDRIRAIYTYSPDVHVNKLPYLTDKCIFVTNVGQHFAIITIFSFQRKQNYFIMFGKCRHFGSR